jgi:hypothetical protein
MRAIALLVLIGLLTACGGGGGGSETVDSFGTASSDSVAAQPAVGDSCAGIHGNPPRLPSPSPQGQLFGLYYPLGLCAARGGEVLNYTDAFDTARTACLFTPSQATPQNPLPLVTFLGGSIFPGDPQTILNSLESLSGSGDLTGDPARSGFTLLVVEGRDKPHFYPFPDEHALGFDNWYRNFNRSDPALNVDVATVDHFISEVKSRGIVDVRRQYMMGHSNGAAMAILYGLNTPGIAATAIYSSPDPFRDIGAPCTQPPFGNNLRPIMMIHNSCDVGGICQTGSIGFGETMAATIPQLELESIIIDNSLTQQETDACMVECGPDSPLGLATPGPLFHLIWPMQWNDEYLAFLRERPLPN